MNAAGETAPLDVCLVARNAATIDDLRAYLQAAGVRCRVARAPCAHAGGARAAAVVFPDDHPEPSRAALVGRLRRGHRLAVVITRDPQRYRAAPGAGELRGEVVILPRPSFGWEILDALRGRAAGSPETPW